MLLSRGLRKVECIFKALDKNTLSEQDLSDYRKLKEYMTTYMNALYYKYWGKARKRDDGTYDYHLLVYHCLDVAAVGRVH